MTSDSCRLPNYTPSPHYKAGLQSGNTVSKPFGASRVVSPVITTVWWVIITFDYTRASPQQVAPYVRSGRVLHWMPFPTPPKGWNQTNDLSLAKQNSLLSSL